MNKAMLVILDGWGIGSRPEVDAIKQANTPTMDHLLEAYPNTTLVTYGEEVGLPAGQMGNSEVGHLNLGAGRIVYQELTRISKALREGTLATNKVLQESVQQAKRESKPYHLMGLISDGGVHSHLDHLIGLANIIAEAGAQKIYIHGFTDGRDVDPKSGVHYIQKLNEALPKEAQLVSIIGRYYAMDRDQRWERTKLAYDLLVNGEGQNIADFIDAINASYRADVTDEFLPPMMMEGTDGIDSRIGGGDTVCFFNFRTDRPRQITQVLTQSDHEEFGMKRLALNYLTMTKYDSSYDGLKVLFEKDNIEKTLGEVIADAGGTQVRIAETEKYPHVTFFFNGGREEPFEGESRILVPSPKVATYDLQPEMSAPEVTQKIEAAIRKDEPNFICLNYANTDMVGHTGDLQAAMVAAETVDKGLSTLIPLALDHDYHIIIIADHGNADIMSNEDGSPHTAHTTNLVPCIYVSNTPSASIKSGKLADIAPTILGLLDVDVPEKMGGENLINKV